jgi:hypothetical protein
MNAKEYPYVYAWGVLMGSFQYYMDGEAEVAAGDRAPSDVIYARDFAQITQKEQDDAIRLESDGTAFIVRRDGEPVRVWHRVNGIHREETRKLIAGYAENLAAGRPARG